MPLRKWIDSANNAIEGILHAAKTQRHLRYHLYTAATVLLLGYVLGITRQEFMIIALAVMAVLVTELINTAVEAVVDMLSPEHSEKARQAKDIAAGAVLITAFVSAVIGYIIFFPHIHDLFVHGFRIVPRAPEEVSVLSSLIVLIMVVLIKAYRGKGHPLSGGMPSGHAALAFSVWVSVTFATGNAIASVLCFVLALLIAQSRVSANVHSRFEAMVGALLGAGVTVALFWVFS
jgi:diacylglycerol kinase (ATP)